MSLCLCALVLAAAPAGDEGQALGHCLLAYARLVGHELPAGQAVTLAAPDDPVASAARLGMTLVATE